MRLGEFPKARSLLEVQRAYISQEQYAKAVQNISECEAMATIESYDPTSPLGTCSDTTLFGAAKSFTLEGFWEYVAKHGSRGPGVPIAFQHLGGDPSLLKDTQEHTASKERASERAAEKRAAQKRAAEKRVKRKAHDLSTADNPADAKRAKARELLNTTQSLLDEITVQEAQLYTMRAQRAAERAQAAESAQLALEASLKAQEDADYEEAVRLSLEYNLT